MDAGAGEDRFGAGGGEGVFGEEDGGGGGFHAVEGGLGGFGAVFGVVGLVVGDALECPDGLGVCFDLGVGDTGDAAGHRDLLGVVWMGIHCGQSYPLSCGRVNVILGLTRGCGCDAKAVDEVLACPMTVALAVAVGKAGMRWDVRQAGKGAQAVEAACVGAEDACRAMGKDCRGVKKEFTGVKKEFRWVNNEFTRVKKEFRGVKNEFTRVKKEFSGVNDEFTRVKKEFTGVKKEFRGVKKEFTGVNKEFTGV